MKHLSLIVAAILTMGFFASCNGVGGGTDSASQNKGDNKGEIVFNNIMTRTSIRQFTDQPIPKDTLDLLAKAGMAAPTAVNTQPWKFVVINEKEVLDSLNQVHPHANLKTATAAIVVCGDMNLMISSEIPKEYWVQDCSAATENILLAAHGFGLGAVWCGVYPVEERINDVSKVLGLPKEIIPLNIITLGHPDEAPQPKNKFKQDNIHYNKW